MNNDPRLSVTTSTQTAMSDQNPDTEGNNIPTPEATRQHAEESGSRAESCSRCSTPDPCNDYWPNGEGGYLCEMCWESFCDDNWAKAFTIMAQIYPDNVERTGGGSEN